MPVRSGDEGPRGPKPESALNGIWLTGKIQEAGKIQEGQFVLLGSRVKYLSTSTAFCYQSFFGEHFYRPSSTLTGIRHDSAQLIHR